MCLKVQSLNVCATYRHFWEFIHKWTFVSRMSNSSLYSYMWGFYRTLKFHLLVLCSYHYISVRKPGNSHQSTVLIFRSLNIGDRQHISESMSFWQIRMLIFLKINFRHLALHILMIAFVNQFEYLRCWAMFFPHSWEDVLLILIVLKWLIKRVFQLWEVPTSLLHLQNIPFTHPKLLNPLKKTAFPTRRSFYLQSINLPWLWVLLTARGSTPFPFPEISQESNSHTSLFFVLLICNGLYITNLTNSCQCVDKSLVFYYLLFISGNERITTPWRLFCFIDIFPTLQFSF